MSRGSGCTIYEHPDKPPICSTWKCLWLRAAQSRNNEYMLNDPAMRPDKCGVMFRQVVHKKTGRTSVFAHVYPSRPRAWTHPPVFRMIDQWLQRGFLLVLYVGKRKYTIDHEEIRV